MTTSTIQPARTHIAPDYTIADVRVDDAMLWITLADGRVVGMPLHWSPRLQAATPEQRANWQLEAVKTGIHWPELDEDISVRVLMGHPS